MFEAHQRLPARLANDQVSSITCSTVQLLIPPPLPSLSLSLSVLSWHLSRPLSLLSHLLLNLRYCIFYFLMRCARIPITELSNSKTAQDSGHHISMWNEPHRMNYSTLSAHTNSGHSCAVWMYICKCTCDQTTLLCWWQPDNAVASVTFERAVGTFSDATNAFATSGFLQQ